MLLRPSIERFQAAFDSMMHQGLVRENSAFAGHSLGEYAALAAIGQVLPIEALVDVVFYRGMTMQVGLPTHVRIHAYTTGLPLTLPHNASPPSHAL